MSASDAEAFLQRLEDDEEFALRMQEVGGNPEATHQRAAEEGFDFSPDEMLEVFGDRYGLEPPPGQLGPVAARDDAAIIAGTVGGTMLAGTVIGAAAGAAAIF